MKEVQVARHTVSIQETLNSSKLGASSCARSIEPCQPVTNPKLPFPENAAASVLTLCPKPWRVASGRTKTT